MHIITSSQIRLGIAFMAMVFGSSGMLTAQYRTRAPKATYQRPSPRVAQVPGPTPAFEPPAATEEAQVFANSPTGMHGAPPLPQESTDSPFMIDSSALDGPMTGPVEGPFLGEYHDESAEGCDHCGPHCDCASEPAPIYSTGTWFRRGDFYANYEFGYMTRDNPRDIGFLIDGTTVGYGFNDLVDHNYHPGARLGLGMFMGRDAGGRDHQAEFSFTGFFQWEDFRSIESRAGGTINTVLDAGLADDVFVTPFNGADAQTVAYSADFNNFELNYRIGSRPGRDQMAMQPDGDWVRFGQSGMLRTWLFGMRAASFNETLLYSTRTAGVTNGRYLVIANNDMFGPHFGGELMEKHDEWSAGLRGRVGGLMNFIDRRSLIDVIDGTGANVATNQKLTDENFTFMAEAGAFVAYQLRPNLQMKFSYDLLYLTGLTLAPENISFINGFPELNVEGHALLHGGFAGFEAIW